MRPRWLVMWLVLTFGMGIGCGETNLLENWADDDSRQAKLEEAHQALDKGDCPKAIDLFTELQSADPNNVGLRIDLAAAYLCRAGFSVTTFVSIAADFGAGTITDNQLFQKIADRAVASISTTWPNDLNAAEALLSENPNLSPPPAFQNDPDAAFNLAIVNMVQTVLTVVDILNYFEGFVNCALQVQQGSEAFQNCTIRAQDVVNIVNGLQNSSSLLDALGVSSDVRDSVNTVLNDMNSATPSDPISCTDITQYLQNQGITTSGQVTCA